MGVTYTAAIERDHRRATVFVRRFEAGHVLFLATSVVCAIAIAMAYLGRVRTMPGTEAGATPILLAPGQRAEALEPAFAEVFSSAQERRRAAREVARFLQARLEDRRPLENVAALLAIRVPPAAPPDLRRSRGAQARASPSAPPVEFQATVLQWLVAYFIGFYALLVLWHAAGLQGDRVLLAGAHVLTALGFALLLSRADPLRDTVLIGRYTQGVLVGLGLAGMVSWAMAAAPSFTRFVYLPLSRR